MRQFVGVKSFFSTGISLKRNALIFEKIAVENIEGLLRAHRDRQMTGMHLIYDEETVDYFLSELEWLYEKGIIIESTDDTLVPEVLFMNRDYSEYSNALRMINQKAKNLGERELFDAELMEINQQHDAIRLRMAAIAVREVKGLDAYPILKDSTISFPPLRSSEAANRSDVIHIVLNKLPIPDDLVPWEQIIEYRADPDTRGKFLALRNWMSEMVRAKLTSDEIEEKLELLLYEYSKHLEMHNLKTKMGLLEAIITIPAEAIEDFVRIKWGKLAKLLFSYKQKKIELSEAEMKASGREVSYIQQTRNLFQK